MLGYIQPRSDAIEFNSLPALSQLLPNGDLSAMNVHVALGVPSEFQNDVNAEVIKKQFPYGTVTVSIEQGGLCCSSGIILAEHGDSSDDDRAVIVVAAVSVFI